LTCYSYAFCGGVPCKDSLYDLVVVGGGIVGLATAREASIRYPDKQIALVEKEEQLGMYYITVWS
jgi:NADPH-dependent 2,4-dienoyl-CoA reductase/sulfur reductase-like enzyme